MTPCDVGHAVAAVVAALGWAGKVTVLVAVLMVCDHAARQWRAGR